MPISGGVIKQRIGREGRGRSGGYRTLIAFRVGDRAVFVFAFAKNERDNIEQSQLRELKEFAPKLLSLDDKGLAIALNAGDIEEIRRAEA